MKNLRNALTAFLIGACLVSVFHYSVLLKDKISASRSLEEMRSRVSALEFEKTGLSQLLEAERESVKKLDQENAQLKETIALNTEKIAGMEEAVRKTAEEFSSLDAKLSRLSSENIALKEQLVFVLKEEEKLRLSMTSIPELKRAIKELKKKRYKQHKGGSKVVLGKKTGKKTEPVEGNKGYLIKDGRPTSAKTVRIKVVPTSSK